MVKMNARIAVCALALTAVFGLAGMTRASAQESVMKQCGDKWHAAQAANQVPAGTTWPKFLSQCRAEMATQPAAPPAAAPAVVAPKPAAAAAPPAPAAQQKTVKACIEEWRANKAAMQASGKTETAYVAECRGTVQPAAAAPAPTPAAAAPPPAPVTTAKPATAPAAPPASPAAGKPAGAGQFANEAQARARCPTDTIVWVNLSSKIYHFSGTKDYGNTKSGAYMCEKDTAKEGMRAAKNETHP